MGEIRIGVSGWSYDNWDGEFYPDDLPGGDRLKHIGEQLDTVEINGSFYSLLSPDTFESYYQAAPDDFVFAVKGSQFITHSKSLKDVSTPLANFFASGVLRLEDKLGPVLWQFPEQEFEHERVEAFLELLPKDTEEASKLARKHDDTVSGRASMKVDARRPVRHALEFRHESFLTDDVVRTARDNGVALVFSHTGGDWPYTEEITAGFLYLRLHGSPHTYSSGYGPKTLDGWASRIRTWAGGDQPSDAERITDRKPPRRKTRDVYVYFDNDEKTRAPFDARRLMERLDAAEGYPRPGTEEQMPD